MSKLLGRTVFTVLAAAGISGISGIANAADLLVPAQFATIQQAIAAASEGDRVLVQPGMYHEAINFVGKGIEVIGVAGAAVTTIDATGLGTTVVSMLNDEPVTTLLRGFTITGGTGFQSGSSIRGGGLCIASSSSPTVRECRITGNSVGQGEYAFGGGIASGGATVIDCEIFDNQASGGGGGIAVGGSILNPNPLIQNCYIHDNQAGRGGGCYGPGDFVDCMITGNHAAGDGGGAYSVHALTGSVLKGNSAGSSGGGYFDYQLYVVRLADCILLENTAKRGGGAALRSMYDAFFGVGPTALISGCVFARNDATLSGDGLYLTLQTFTVAQTTLTNCTFDADWLGSSTSSYLEMKNCIIRGVAFSSAPAASYSNIEGGAVGPGNIDADPLWVDPGEDDYRLQGCSPCLDAGDPSSPVDADGTPADMGGLPFASWTDLNGGVAGSSGDAVLAGSGLLVASAPATFTLTDAVPNSPAWIVMSARALEQPFKGGTFWPALDVVVTGLSTDASGGLQLSGAWPPLIGCGFTLYAQVWWLDAGAESGWAGSNGLRAVSR